VSAQVVSGPPARTPPTLFQPAEAKVFLPLAEEAAVLSDPVAVPHAVQGRPQSATRAVWESEHRLVSAPAGLTRGAAPRWVAAREDLFEQSRPPQPRRRLHGEGGG
jgi:hypothetical protein